MRIALDPWGSDYGSQLTAPYEIDSEEASSQTPGKQVEDGPWEPKTPRSTVAPQVTAVVDGVMRVDARTLVTEGDKRFLGLFCSYAAGAVVINRHVEIVGVQVERLFLTGGGQSGPSVIEVPAGNKGTLCYRSQSAAATTPDKLNEALAIAMRESERKVADSLALTGSLILVDGNLSFFDRSSSVVGVIKTIQRMYLTAREATILERLGPGERTPLFRLPGSSQRNSYISCYLRLARPRLTEHPFAGLVRLEVSDSLGEQNALTLLDQAAVKVVDLASRAPKDPRAPQNLIPIGGLERQLRHRLGDAQLVRRGIEKAILAMLEQERGGSLVAVRRNHG